MRSDRLALASGAVYVLAILIGNAMYEAGKTGDRDGPGILADLQRTTSTVQTIGLVLEVLGFTAFLVFLGALYRILRRAEGTGGWLAATALGAGLVTVAVKVGSLGPAMAANRRVEELTPELARTLHDLADADFVVSGYTSGIFVAAASAATLATRVLPRWLAIAGVVVGVLTIAAGTAGVVDPAGYVPVPFLLGLLWILITSAVLTIRGHDGRRRAEPRGRICPGGCRRDTMIGMARLGAARAAWIVPLICAALLLGAVLWERATRSGVLGDVVLLANLPLSLGFALVGALIVSRRPGNRLGWLYLGCATAMALTLFVFQYAWFGLVTRPGAVPGAVAAAWVSSWIWALGLAPLLTLGLLLYPDARFPSPRWRWLGALAGVTVLCLALPGALMPGPFVNHPTVDNPLGIEGAGPVLRGVGAVGFPLVVVGLAAGVASLAVRWRRAVPGGLERRQLSLLLLAAVLCLGLFASPDDDAPPWLAVISLVVLALVPGAIGLAVVRHRLYEIDVVLNRSLVYAGLTGTIVALYTALVWALGRPLAVDAWAAAVAVGIIGALVLPLRTWLQQVVDRAMYGDRGDPYAALSRLTARLQAATAPGAALPALADAIAASLRLPYVRVEATTGEDAAAGEPHGGPLHELPLDHQGQRVGRLLLEGRDRRPLDARDLQLLTELARPAGAAVSAAALSDALSASRARLVQAREEERRRLRRDLHDGLGPTLAGVALGLDLVAARLEDDPPAARALLGELKGETAAAVDDVRRLVHGLRPPALDELGLVRALRQQTERLALRSPDLEIRVEASEALPPLSAATEVAAFRIAVEAVTNSVRHADAHTCRVRVTADEALQVEVVDDGSGIVTGTRPGVGLGAMHERAAEVGGVCTVAPADAGGTRVLAVLPLDPP